MKYIFGAIIVIGFLLLMYSRSYAQTEQEYDFPIQFSVSQTGINRFISSQWAGNQTSWSDPTHNLNYSILLERPYILLTDNKIILHLEIHISSTVYSGVISLKPTLSIPATTLSASGVVAQYSNLRQHIDNITAFPDASLKDVLEQILTQIDWIIYQGVILDQMEHRWLNTADIRWTGLPSLEFSVVNSELILTITPRIKAKEPHYVFKFKRLAEDESGISYYVFSVESNNAIEIGRISVFPNSSLVFNSANPQVSYWYDALSDKFHAETQFPGFMYDPIAMHLSNPQPVPTGFPQFSFAILLKRNDAQTFWKVYVDNVISNEWQVRDQDHVHVIKLQRE
jgi:hypothetical protein